MAAQLPLLAAKPVPQPAAKVETKTYTGWKDSLFLNAAGVQAVVVPSIGGRIVHYSVNNENIIYEIAASAGKTLANTKTNFWVGGYQCDLGPELRGPPEHTTLWMGEHRGEFFRDNGVKLTSPPDMTVGIQMEKEIVIDPASGDLGITQRMKNVLDRETAFCLWDRTLCKGGGFAFFPLNKKSRFAAKWSIRRTIDGKYIYDGASPASDKVKILKDVLVAKAEGEPTKIGADSDAGWIAYVRGKLLFVKYFPYSPAGNYSDGGNSVELYFDPRVAELEPLSPEIKLRPGESYTLPEKWTLIELEKDVDTFEQARSLIKKILPSPFKR